ncbi:MAG: glycosyltransferase [Thermodesulfobacteriota bacterium]
MNIVCFGNEWGSWVRRSNRILLGLHENKVVERVIFFERPLTFRNIFEYLTGKANFTVNERCRRLFKHGFLLEVSEGVTVVNTVIPAFFFGSGFLQSINEWIRSALQLFLLKRLKKSGVLNEEKLLLWFQRPEFNSRYIARIPHWKVLYDCTEDYLEQLKNETDVLFNKYKHDDAEITACADLITTVSKDFAALKVKSNPNTHWISNGVDYKEFVDLANDGEGRRGVPVFALIGILNHRCDLDLITQLAATYPDAVIELVGSVNDYIVSKVRESGLTNVRFIPSVAASEIPAYLSRVDVCLSLYKDDYLNRSGSSMKIYQYLASGKPIVSYAVADAEYFSDAVYLAGDRKEYIKLVRVALDEPPDDPKVAFRREHARNNDWLLKTDEFCALIRGLAASDQPTPAAGKGL